MTVAEKTIDIDGCVISYLERDADSDELVVLLHGLGLDAEDYRPFLDRQPTHGIAPTLPGFEPGAPRGRTFGIIDYGRLISTFINRLHANRPDQRLTLAGFSLGADMVLGLAEYWTDYSRSAPKLHGVVLLDPNVNHSTMTISRIFSQLDPANPVPDLLKVAQLATTVEQFTTTCRYLARVSAKDLRQLRRHASDFVHYWEAPGRYGLIRRRLATLARLADQVRVVLSAPYEEHLPALRAVDADNVSFELTALAHFQLIDESRLVGFLS